MTKKNKVIRRDLMPVGGAPVSFTLALILALHVWNAREWVWTVCMIIIGILWISYYNRLFNDEYIDVVEKDNGIKS
jgi:hypothetical protein